jgi:hypothetical protein
MFDITKEDLKDLLKSINDGRLQLPDFQRSYVWGDDDVRSLIASVAKGFPVGALLTLETGGPVKFKARLLEGVPAKTVEPSELLLDGQQRMTSLFQTMYSQTSVLTKTQRNTEVSRFYYIDIKAALEPDADIGDAILGVPADRIVRNYSSDTGVLDLSTSDLEYQHNMFPANRIFDAMNWIYGWRNYWEKSGSNLNNLDQRFYLEVVDRIQRYKVPIIRLDKQNSREAICLVFEKVNVGGKKLDAFELVTAIYAADGFLLREDWNGDTKTQKPGRLKNIIGHPNRRDVLSKLPSTDFLQCCTLLHTRQRRLDKITSGATGKEIPPISCNRDALLGLPLIAYKTHADSVEGGFIAAATFLNEQKIIWQKDVPYPPQIVAMAAVSAILKSKAATAAAKKKLATWFWCVTLGELYGSGTESKLARDVPELVEWIEADGAPPRSINEAIFRADRLWSLRSRQSAAYKGIHALMMRHGCRDFISGKPVDIMTFFNDKVDIHHIFPQAWCKLQGKDPSHFNSIINKTPLSDASNRTIGGAAPSIYLKKIEATQGISPEELDDILRSHLIEPAFLRADDFEGFLQARMAALGGIVSDAMGKRIVHSEAASEPERDTEEDLYDDPAEVQAEEMV